MPDVTKKPTAKDRLKQLSPYWIILFVFCYMLFIYEPLMMYCTNKDDFWFDFGIMAAPAAGIFLIFFFGSAAVFTGLFFLSEKISGVVLSVVFSVFIVLYIQGNYLVKALPVLDGSAIDWGEYSGQDIITLIICVIAEVAVFFAVMKFGLEKTVKYAAEAALILFAALTVSLAVRAVQNDLFQRKNIFLSSADDLSGASSDKNFFIFMVDAQNAAEFSRVINERGEFQTAFDDFTFFSDAMSVYPFTRESVPQILSGYVYKNEDEYGVYSARAYNGSPFFKELDSRGYDIFLYDNELVWYGEKAFDIKNNAGSGNAKLKFGEFFEQEMRYVWFKYLPYAFKKAAEIEKLDFGQCVDMFNYRNDTIYNEIKSTGLSLTPKAQFRFIHAEGAHAPLNMDEDLNRIENGTYMQKTIASVKLIAAFLERLRENGAYDNSVIMIMSDHGYQSEPDKFSDHFLMRSNPILLIKGFGEKHGLAYSEKPVSYLDLQQAYTDLLNGKQSSELFPDAEFPRIRTFIRAPYGAEEHMVEYQTDGRADEWEKFRETGAVFDLTKK